MLIPAPELSVFRCFGNDAEAFLQSQFTADVCSIAAEGWSLSGYCSPKGRLLAVFIVCRQGNDFLLSTHDSLADSVIARLRMYVMRADVSFESLTDQNLVFHDNRTSSSGVLSSQSDSFSLQDLLEISTIDAVASKETASSIGFRKLCIELGLPIISGPLSEAMIPQSVNLDLIGGVSFTKGCYPGQEIVARVRYRGKPKQRMIRAIGEHGGWPEPGTQVRVETATSGRDGVVICAEAADTSGEMQLLAAVPIEVMASPESGSLFWKDIPLTVSPLPYPIPTDAPG